VRTEQDWIGGTSPLDAHLVTPPPREVPDLLDDLVASANREDLDAIAHAAVCHAQLEVIHPFADGNGRVGRVLIAWVLVRRLALVTAPPVSRRIAADVGGYAAGLTLFRVGEHEYWVRWFADAVSGAGRAQQDLARSLESLLAQWTIRLGAPRAGARRLRENSAAWAVLELVPRHVVLTAPLVVRELGSRPRLRTPRCRSWSGPTSWSSRATTRRRSAAGRRRCSSARSCSDWLARPRCPAEACRGPVSGVPRRAVCVPRGRSAW